MMKRLILGLCLVAATARAQNLCPCPQGDDLAYETDTKPVSPSVVTLCTADGCGALNVQVTHRIVTPANVTGMPFAPDPHYLAVEASNNAGFPEPSGAVTLQTDMGALLPGLVLAQPRFLFAPCEKSLVSPPPPPPAQVAFICSKLKSRPGLKITLMETDQFGANLLALDRLAYVCQAADLTAPGVNRWLACFSLNKKASTLVDPTGPVFVNAEFFGSIVAADPGQIHTPDEFCFFATRL
jgi:hypothetical protein